MMFFQYVGGFAHHPVLLSASQQKTEYDFLPYKFGYFSYSANADMTAMVEKGQLAESETHFSGLDNTDYLRR